MDISNLFGIPVVMPASGNYTSSVLPIVCAIAFAASVSYTHLDVYKRQSVDTLLTGQ